MSDLKHNFFCVENINYIYRSKDHESPQHIVWNCDMVPTIRKCTVGIDLMPSELYCAGPNGAG